MTNWYTDFPKPHQQPNSQQPAAAWTCQWLLTQAPSVPNPRSRSRRKKHTLTMVWQGVAEVIWIFIYSLHTSSAPFYIPLGDSWKHPPSVPIILKLQAAVCVFFFFLCLFTSSPALSGLVRAFREEFVIKNSKWISISIYAHHLRSTNNEYLHELSTSSTLLLFESVQCTTHKKKEKMRPNQFNAKG